MHGRGRAAAVSRRVARRPLDAHAAALVASAQETGLPEALLDDIIRAAREASRQGARSIGAAQLDKFVEMAAGRRGER